MPHLNILMRRRFCRCKLIAVLVSILPCCPAASAQEREVPPLLLGGVVPGGVRTSATESWAMFDFSVTNWTNQDRLARVLVFFPDRPDVQYGRDVWVPAHSTQSSWMLVGPGSHPKPGQSSEIQMLLYDRTDGTDRLILPPTEERIRARGVLHR